MVMTTYLPQHHCPNTADHSHHVVWPEPWGLTPDYECPGRYTPDQLATNQPIARSADPFAGIPDAGGSVWD